MFKTNFYVHVTTAKGSKEYQQKTGWGEFLKAPNGSPVSLRFDRRTPYGWRITEESTGYAVSGDYYRTRAEAVRILTPEILQKIADRLGDPEMLRAAEALAAFILSQNSAIDKAAAGQYNKAKE